MAFSKFRDKIDQIDSKILDLLSQRADLAKELVSEKRRKGLPVADEGREAKVVQRLRDLNQGPLSDDMIEKIFVNFFSVFRKLQHDEIGIMTMKTGPRELAGKQVGIVGLGLMGGSVAKALQTYLPQLSLLIFDPLAAGKKWNSFDVGGVKDLKICDILILAMPVGEIYNFLETDGPSLKQDALVIDLGSTKTEIISRAKQFLPTTVDFIGGHPLVGKEVSGFANSHENLFRDEIFTLSPSATVRPANLAIAEALLRVLGAKKIIVAGDRHDKILGLTSHLPHLVCLALANVEVKFKEGRDERVDLIPRSYRELARLAASSSHIWCDIFLSNKENLVELLTLYEDEIKQIKEILSENSESSNAAAKAFFERGFKAASNYYLQISAPNS